MTNEKFKSEIKTLTSFFETYCKANHKEQEESNELIVYKQEQIPTKINLCNECKKLYFYSVDRLQNCPHEEKPKCRKCPNPCYEKVQWKALAKIMRSSGMKLGLTKIKKFLSK